MHENVFKHLDIQWWLFQEQNEEVRGGGGKKPEGLLSFHFQSMYGKHPSQEICVFFYSSLFGKY